MGIRFRKSVKIAPGLKLNFNKKSVGLTLGGKGAHYTINSSGTQTKSVGIPGTGLYYQDVSKIKSPYNQSSEQHHSSDEFIEDDGNDFNGSESGNGDFESGGGAGGNDGKNNHGCLKILLAVLLWPFIPAWYAYKVIKNPASTRSKKVLVSILAALLYILIGIGMGGSDSSNTSGSSSLAPSSAAEVSSVASVAEPENATSSSSVPQSSSASTSVPETLSTPKPEVAITPSAATAPVIVQEEQKSNMVWVSGKGKKYHSNPGCSAMKSPTEISLDDAKARGYTACKKCY